MISVCIPTYNQANYVEEAIRSAANQSCEIDEIIVSDDCSTDNTIQVLERLQSEIKHLLIIKQPQNLGIAKNTDACLRRAKGDYIIRLDSDDCLEKKFVEKLLGQVVNFPNWGYAHTSVQEIDSEGKKRNIRRLARKKIYQNPEEALLSSIKGYRVSANIIMFKKEALIKVDYLTNRPNYVEDYHLTTAISAAGYGNIYLDEVLSCYRVWIDAQKVRQKRKMLEITGIQSVFDKVLEPYFNNKNWDTRKLVQARADFASQQADCLSWDIYSTAEKKELRQAILKLSNSRKAVFYVEMYSKGFGFIFRTYKVIFQNLKKFLKNFRNSV